MERKNIPLYKLTINDSDESGVSYVALVDEPAIEQNWLSFSKQQQFRVVSNEQRIITGPLMVPERPIYRVDDKMGEHYVVFDRETISKIILKFFRNRLSNNVNLMHQSEYTAEGVYLFESFQTDSKRGITAPKGFEKLPEGTWFASYKIDNEAVWEQFVKTGVFKGFSVEGLFVYTNAPNDEEILMKRILEVLKEVAQ